MFSASSFITILALALAVAANPVVVRDQSHITLSAAKRINALGTTKLVEGDRARASALRARVEASQSGNVVSDAAAASSNTGTNVLVEYVATVSVGSPATTYTLGIDTGSSNTWIGADKAYKKTSTSVQTKNKVEVSYGSGSFSGTEYTDTVSLSSALSITAQSIGVASTSEGFSVDGLLGIGPADLTLNTLSPANTTTIPTVTDNLFSQGKIPEHLVAVAFAPTTTDNNANGELTFGGTDSSKFTGSITYTPITSTFPASAYWGINETITYGTASTPILANAAGIVDTGTTLLLLSTEAIAAYQEATGAVVDDATGLLKVTSAQFASLQSLFFTIGGTTFEFTANAQIWPRALNTDIGGVSFDIYLIVGSLGSSSSAGFEFVNGMAWLERFYAVFDTANARVGIATTANTDATTN